jgi:ApaG protein
VLGEQIHLNYKIRFEKFVNPLIFITFTNPEGVKKNSVIQQITKGIKISVETKFEGSFLKDQISHHAFMYFITIENQSKDVVQLLSRHWKILESLSRPQYVNGNGVVGKKPVIKPGESHTYQSGSLITSPLGSMTGTYIMINFSTAKKFNVDVPSFKLSVPHILN